LQAALFFGLIFSGCTARPHPTGKVHLKLLLSLIRQKASMRISLACCLLAAPASALLATRPVPSQPTQRARLPRMQEAADFEKLRFENLKLKKEVRNIPSR
jgi:hypothetical protein